MEKCIQSVLAGGEDVEVIIVDDGSTKMKQQKLQMNMQQNIRRLLRRSSMENGGHGTGS